MKEAIFHPEARAETDSSVEFYEVQLDGLGLRFLSAVEETTERISGSPDAGAPLEGEYRKRIVPGFPYNIIYRVGRTTFTWSPSRISTAAQAIGASEATAASPALEPTGLRVVPRPERSRTP